MKKLFSLMFGCLLAATVLHLGLVCQAQERATADVTETFAAEYMPNTKALLDNVRKIRSADGKLLADLQAAGLIMETYDYADGEKAAALRLLADKWAHFKYREDSITASLKDLYFKHMAELVEAEDVAKEDTRIAQEGVAWLAEHQDCRTIYMARSSKPDLSADYLVIDLLTFSKKALSAPPAGGWTDYHKTEALVLRKVDNFWIGIFEVTQRQWACLKGNNPSDFSEHPDSPMRPVVKVNWREALEFCQIDLTQSSFMNQFGLIFTLPMESQWELAARGGGNHIYSGSDNLGEVGWYSGNSGSQTHVVGTKKPNGFGLYDMSGNVWEWCFDGGRDSDRANRGGSWSNDAYCAVAFRSSRNPANRYHNLGFRVALVSSSQK